MADKITPIDWVEDVCSLVYFMAASYQDKIYTVGGSVKTRYSSDSVADSYLRIVDFSKPIYSSKNSIDISTDSITTAIRLPDNIPRLQDGTLFISDGVMHMLPGRNAYNRIVDASGKVLDTTRYLVNLTNSVWDFDLDSKKWDLHVSEIEDQAQGAAVAFDAEKQIGWYYGGTVIPDQYFNGPAEKGFNLKRPVKVLRSLYSLNRGKRTPRKVEVDSVLVGSVNGGELVYIEGAGAAGILVLIGGEVFKAQQSNMRSMQLVHVFDIATKTWFPQTTTAQGENYPNVRTSFCSVVASARDNSSHNIYIYGGYSEFHDVPILTLPAFHWVQVYPSAKDESDYYSRQTYAHKCQKVHEKHMVAYRGNTSYGCDFETGLNKPQGIAIYDMSSLTWTTKVELQNPKYMVPGILYDIIGGDALGGANFTIPRRGYLDPRLAQVFSSVTALPTNNHSQSSPPVGAIAGGIVGSIVLVLVIVALLLLKRRQRQQPISGLPLTPAEPQELQECGLYELPPALTELEASIPEN